MRRLRVDFNQAVGDILPIPLNGEVLTVGDHVAVYDLDTDTYEAVVQEVSATTAVLQLNRA